MRIRKNLRFRHQVSSESSFSGTAPLQAHIICQLNQSPWDVSPSSPLFQLQEHDSFLGNGPCEDVNGPSESVAKMILENRSVIEEHEEEVKLEEIVNYCSKTDENGNWICGLEAKEGETFCEFHLRSYIALAPHVVHPVNKKSTTKSGKNNGAKKAKTEENPYQSFNYYSGFGPNWGKKRAARELSKGNEVVPTPSSSNGTEDLSVFEYEEEDDDEKSEVNGTKRVRKRIKARSLKSLM